MILLGILALAVAAGVVVLATIDIPAPTKTREITLPNDRLPR